MKKVSPLSGIAAIILSVVLVSCNGKNGSNTIRLNQNIHHDDFEYSVTSFQRTSSLTEMNDQVAKPYLMVRGGILMGDVFDNARFRKMKIRLF